MKRIPEKLKQEILNDPYYQSCARKEEGDCQGRITWEHAFIYAGKQINEKWAIIPLCEYHHAVCNYQDKGDLNKSKNRWIALNRATDQELSKYEKGDFIKLKQLLNKKYAKNNIRK